MTATSEPDLPSMSVVVGARGPTSSLEACLRALDPQRGDVEVIVCEADPSTPDLHARFPWVRFLDGRDGLVPHLWRDGIHASTGHIVALTNSTMVPAEDWLASLADHHRGHDVVAGAIEPARGLRVSDWAEYFCRYAPDMLPFEPRASTDLPGDNASYKRELLETTRDLYQDGFWEPSIHRRLWADGARLWHSPAVIVRQGRSSGARAFALQRFRHGRAHGSERAADLSRSQNLLRVLGAPLVPLVLAARMMRNVFARGRLRRPFVLALPFLMLFNVAWAAGEAVGHATRVGPDA